MGNDLSIIIPEIVRLRKAEIPRTNKQTQNFDDLVEKITEAYHLD